MKRLKFSHPDLSFNRRSFCQKVMGTEALGLFKVFSFVYPARLDTFCLLFSFLAAKAYERKAYLPVWIMGQHMKGAGHA